MSRTVFYRIAVLCLILGVVPAGAQLKFSDSTQQNTAYPGSKAAGSNAAISGGAGNTAGGSFATVGGGQANEAWAAYTTIAGGGPTTPGAPSSSNNEATDNYCTIGGGGGNLAGDRAGTYEDATFATVAGGYWNWAGGRFSTVAGGAGADATGLCSTVGGGNTNEATGDYATIAGGDYNKASGETSSVGGGFYNYATNTYATVGGGIQNEASGGTSTIAGGADNAASNSFATVGGGTDNTASGFAATVPGGLYNVAAGDGSVALGNRAKVDANHDYTFVFSDGNNFDFGSTSPNSFSARVTGGAWFVTAIDGSGNATTGAYLSPGGGSWGSISDRNLKENVVETNGADVLKKVADLPISTWNYISQDDDIRHMGPMAQDFKAAFGVGEDERHITAIDADGVALAAIQGLNELVEAQRKELDQLREELTAMRAELKALHTGQE